MALRRAFLRLDDACPSMNVETWRRVELIVDALGIKPIVGVIPDCRDPEMAISPPDKAFWSKVRAWQQKGWTIALHGLHHIYHDDPPGFKPLIPLHRRGEFVGLPLADQRALLRASWAEFQKHAVIPTMFMAPSHSFDERTLEALVHETPIRWLTDGVSFRPFSRYGLAWLPQQLGVMHSWLPPGVWTICIHPNFLSNQALLRLEAHLTKCARWFEHFDPEMNVAEYGLPDLAFSSLYWLSRHLKMAISGPSKA